MLFILTLFPKIFKIGVIKKKLRFYSYSIICTFLNF